MIKEASKASRRRGYYMCSELLVCGARGRIRTDDLPITSRMRYHYATRAGGAAERVGVEAECTEGRRDGPG
jgi:hypothetical protein